jgi:hypothetical protein
MHGSSRRSNVPAFWRIIKIAIADAACSQDKRCIICCLKNTRNSPLLTNFIADTAMIAVAGLRWNPQSVVWKRITLHVNKQSIKVLLILS